MSESRDRYVLLCQQALVCAVVGAVVAPAAGIVTLDIVPPTRPPTQQIAANAPGETGSLVATEPVEPTVREIRLTPTAVGRSARGLAPNTGGAEVDVVTRPETVQGFATVGVTWEHGVRVDEESLSISVRTKKDGIWGAWEALEYHEDHQPDPGSPDAVTSRPGTEAYVVGDVDDVQVRAEDAAGLPADLKLAVIDPGTTAAAQVEEPAIDTARLSAFQSGEPVPPEPAEPEPENPAIVPTAGVDVTPQPKIFSRAQWGADERMRDRSSLRYGEVHAGFVHHTVNANDYTKKEVPAILRGIYAYHTQSRGWSDIGYNFLVDRFGRIWEGRYGGVGRPAVGAHTLNYNDYAFAMSAIGNFELVQPSAAMIDAYARLFAWKLSLHGVSASSTSQWVGSRYFQAINGHRNAASTACPGRYLYAKLAKIRSLTTTYQRSFASRNLSTNLSGTSWPDLAVREAATGRLALVRTGGQATYGPRAVVGSGFGAADLVAAPGDLDGDGYADFVARNKATKVTTVYAGTSTGRLGASIRDTDRFADLDLLIGVGDFDGDKRNDLVGRDAASKKLFLFPGTGHGAFGDADALSPGWTYQLTTGVGDFDRDGSADLVARDAAGRLFLVPGAGRRLGTPVLLASGFAGFDLVAGRGDITNDGYPDLIARESVSRLTRVYTGDGKGGLGTWNGPFDRFANVSWLGSGGQFVGSGAPDVLGLSARGKLLAFPNSGGRNLSGVVRTNVTLSDTNAVLNVGDWNHDGLGDVMTRSTAGAMMLHLGKGDNTFAAPVVAAAGGWSPVRQLVSVGDVTGDGNNDLMGRWKKGGPFMIWPGNGALGLRAGYEAHSGLGSNRQVAVGLYDGDGAPDTMTTKRNGSLWFFPGNGPGGMTGGRQVGSGLQGYDWLVGLGDLDGDRRSDLIGRARSNGALYLIPGTAGGFGRARFLAAGFQGYDLAG